ncbi:hypothetical protein FIE12Z_6391 [Fusarium flagelliforme]|uniref:Zn(2)-C6 fungal-type domain-containing protein n=1 Tax=Fusarium flagelliforme TaxID=2675880 RepID=A0A395MQC4_9HYPO|nr:hypothetical protein FIE12Z_6391 [Fusarium flagelliforme]
MLSPTTPNRSSNAGRSRASCEPCRTRKVRCSGEIPVCSKCVATKRKCVYSIQKRAGRPKTRQNTREDSSPMHLEEPQLSSAVSPARTTTTTHVIEENECSRHEGLGACIPPYVVDYESNMPAHTHSDILTQTDINDSCACLSILYLLLNRLGVRTELKVPDDLALLRNTFERAADVLDCQKCPLRYSSVLQNAGILGILCVCIAESYVRFIKSIDAKTIEANDKEEKLRVVLDTHSHTTDESLSVPIEVPPEQWKRLMYSAVRSEIFGMREHRDNSFISFIERLEDRQTRWHTLPMAPDCPPTYQSACSSTDELPLCLTITKAARKVLEPISSTLDG